jgi:multidrug efflux system membrane fusion protein
VKSLALVVSAAGVVSLAACQNASAPKAEAKQAPALPADVQAVAAAVAPETKPAAAVPASDGFTGEFVSPVRSELVAKVQGRVGKVFVDEGARVRKGQPLLELETEYLALDEKRAQSEVERTRASADESRRDFERKKSLLEKESVAQAVYDRSRAQWEQADAAQRSAVAALDMAKQRLADAVLVSPIDGVVAERRADVGERLSDNTIAFVLLQTAPLKLRFRVPERYLAQAQLGQAVKARVDPYPGQAFSGRIAVVGTSIDPATRTFLVEAEFANADGKLRPGLFARVEAALGGGAE